MFERVWNVKDPIIDCSLHVFPISSKSTTKMQFSLTHQLRTSNMQMTLLYITDKKGRMRNAWIDSIPSNKWSCFGWLIICITNLTVTLTMSLKETKSASRAIVTLKPSGVDSFTLALFYRARVLSVLSHAAPLSYPHVTDKC